MLAEHDILTKLAHRNFYFKQPFKYPSLSLFNEYHKPIGRDYYFDFPIARLDDASGITHIRTAEYLRITVEDFLPITVRDAQEIFLD
jgi:hypothetical protein